MSVRKTWGLEKVRKFLGSLFGEDVHAMRVFSMGNATLGVLCSAPLAVHTIGQGLAHARGPITKHAVKRVNRLLSNRGTDVWSYFAYWVPFVVGSRPEIYVALDWTEYDSDDQSMLALTMVTRHGRATPLVWKTVRKSTLKGQRNAYEDELLLRFKEVAPEGVKVILLAPTVVLVIRSCSSSCATPWALASSFGGCQPGFSEIVPLFFTHLRGAVLVFTVFPKSGCRGICYCRWVTTRRTLGIEVHPDRRVKVRAPVGCAEEVIEQRMRKRAAWISRELADLQRYSPRTPQRQYLSGETLLYLGRQCRLKVGSGTHGSVKMTRGRVGDQARGVVHQRDQVELAPECPEAKGGGAHHVAVPDGPGVLVLEAAVLLGLAGAPAGPRQAMGLE